ncbi:hypothetical protein [Bacillus marinisedimentorum]|uniref:hypothetical protein n=1 Tax=Bacillus marinisedimentorum TaxID=1821260 RepID=UPI001470D758|nr:hypothetical protein [Bacillus marinisedimentorum]
MKNVKKLLIMLAAAFLSFWLLTACNQEKKTETPGEITGNEADASRGTQLADSLAITESTLGKVKADYETSEPIALVNTDLDDQKITLIFQADSATDESQAEEIVGQVLLEISKKTVDSEQLEGGYATVYNQYDVDIIIQDTNTNPLLTGKMPAGTQQIEWK